jgi:hypothetical protein
MYRNNLTTTHDEDVRYRQERLGASVYPIDVRQIQTVRPLRDDTARYRPEDEQQEVLEAEITEIGSAIAAKVQEV